VIQNFAWRVFICCIIVSLTGTTLLAQDQQQQNQEGNQSSDTGDSYTPEPYRDDEFEPWMHKLRRAETILFGSIPLTFLFSRMAVDVVRYGSSGFDSSYAPPLFGNQTPVPLTDEEKTGILVSTIVASAFVTLLDFIIGEIQKASENKQEKQ
jgi:hypothetical protein